MGAGALQELTCALSPQPHSCYLQPRPLGSNAQGEGAILSFSFHLYGDKKLHGGKSGCLPLKRFLIFNDCLSQYFN